MNWEYQHQVAVANYLDLRYPNILWSASSNGMKLPIGVARKLKAAGYKAGVPDIAIYHAWNGYHAMFIEMKTPQTEYSQKGKCSEDQKEWHKRLEERGYKVCVCYGSEEAIKAIDEYLGGVK